MRSALCLNPDSGLGARVSSLTERGAHWSPRPQAVPSAMSAISLPLPSSSSLRPCQEGSPLTPGPAQEGGPKRGGLGRKKTWPHADCHYMLQAQALSLGGNARTCPSRFSPEPNTPSALCSGGRRAIGPAEALGWACKAGLGLASGSRSPTFINPARPELGPAGHTRGGGGWRGGGGPQP